MKSGFIGAVLILALVLAVPAAAQSSAPATVTLPATTAGWSDAAKRDIAEAYQAFSANHPGMKDPSNPAFAGQLDQARSESLALADKVTGPASYVAALQRFSVILQDGHAQIFAGPEVMAQLPAQRWPGFVAAWRGDGLFVYQSEPGGPARGSKIVSCDGCGDP